MARYTSEQKAQALQSMAEIGVVKTKEALGISTQTLYKWKNESNPTQAEPKEVRRGRKSAPLSEAIADAKAEARALLAEDDGLAEKISALEAENAALRAMNLKLKKALAALVE